MSRTYKTEPLWLHIKKNRNGDFPIEHNHAVPGHEECDVDQRDERSVRYYVRNVCQPVFNHYSKKQLRYVTRPSAHREFAKVEHAKTRTTERNALSKAKYLSREDIEDFDLPERIGRKDLWWDML